MKKAYFYSENADQFTFFRVPKILFTDEYINISSDAKLLYGMLLDRMSLSLKNGWLDEEGRVFIIYTAEEIMEQLHIAKQKTAKLLAELENDAELIERKRQGLGKPNLIYLKNFAEVIPDGAVDNSVEEKAKMPNSNFKRYENHTSRILKTKIQEVPESNGNNTEINNTDLSDTDIYPIPSSLVQRLRQKDTMRSDSMMEHRNEVRDYLEEKLEIEILKQSHPYDTQELDEIFEILVDTLCSTKKTIRISGDEKPIEVVKSVFMKLDSSHIEYALECFKKNTTEVRNIRAYMLATLYNASFTMNSYYTSLVHHDMPYLAK